VENNGKEQKKKGLMEDYVRKTKVFSFIGLWVSKRCRDVSIPAVVRFALFVGRESVLLRI
jgi:hypothetical protein